MAGSVSNRESSKLKQRGQESRLLGTTSGENQELREVQFHASFALRVPIPTNYMNIMSNISSYNASHCYRLSYKLLPSEEKTDIDVSLFGPVAKMYCKDQTLCLKVFEDTDTNSVWIAWSKQHSLNITDEVLMSLFSHVCNVTIMEAADRARLDHPKGFCVSDVVYERLQLMRMCSQWIRTPSYDSTLRTPASYIRTSELIEEHWENLSQISLVSMEVNDVPAWQEIQEISHNSMASSGTYLTSSSETSSAELLPFSESTSAFVTCALKAPENLNYKLLHNWIIAKNSSLENSEYLQAMDDIPKRAEEITTTKLKRAAQASTNSPLNQKPEKKSGRILPIIQIKMQAFFSGITSQVGQVEPSRNPSTAAEIIFLVSIEGELLSLRQKIALNPLTVKLQCVEDLPQLPPKDEDNDEETEPSFKPAYMKYQLMQFKKRRTRSLAYNTKIIVWNDSYVYLMGLLSPAKVREFFCGPPLEVEIHDRDSKAILNEMSAAKPSIFGSEPLDKFISSPAAISHKMISDNAFIIDQPHNLFGVAHLNLSEFLRGCTRLDFCEPVICSLFQKRHQSVIQKYIKESIVEEDIYFNAGTALEAKIILSIPMFNPVLGAKELFPRPYFARIIITFSSKERNFLHKLLKAIIDINTNELAKNGLPLKDCLARAIPLLPVFVKAQQSMDIITGLHVFENHSQVFCLEGRALGSLLILWNWLSRFVGFSQIKILYNSSMIFSERLYNFLPTYVCHLRLCLSLKKLLSNAHKFINNVSSFQAQCLEGLQNIHKITQCNSLEEVARNNLFLTQNTILSISQQVGEMLTIDQIANMAAPPVVTKTTRFNCVKKTCAPKKKELGSFWLTSAPHRRKL